jgi:beta-N-acetylhexosaminidase
MFRYLPDSTDPFLKKCCDRVRIITRWLFAAVLLLIAINLKNTYLFNYRKIETPAIILLSSIGLWLSFRKISEIPKRKKIHERSLYMLALAMVIIVAVSNETVFRYKKYRVLNCDTKQCHELSRHLIVGYTEYEEIFLLASKGLIGGVFITQKNITGKTASEIRAEIETLQNIRYSQHLPPLIIAADQEGGIVSRLSPPLTRLAPLSSLIREKHSPAELEKEALTYGEIHGKELSDLGVNVNFSPIADLKFPRQENPMDFHTHIDKRAISDDETVVCRIALSYSHGLEKHGVFPTVKHFPGMGRVSADTHHFTAKLATSRKELEAKDWIPFKYVIEHSDALMMLGHIVVTDIDPENPASCSYKLIQGIIRQEWKHDGVLVTDDLTMRAIQSNGIEDSAVKALNAGGDLLLISYDSDKYYDVMYHLISAYRDKKLDDSILEKSRKRLDRLISFL